MKVLLIHSADFEQLRDIDNYISQYLPDDQVYHLALLDQEQGLENQYVLHQIDKAKEIYEIDRVEVYKC